MLSVPVKASQLRKSDTEVIFQKASEYNKTISWDKLFYALWNKNHDLARHSARVAIYSQILGEKISNCDKFGKQMFIGGLFHDIGKLNFPEILFTSASALSGEDLMIAQKHPEDGIGFAKEMNLDDEKVYNIILRHHIRYDLQGYPKSKGSFQCLSASVIAVCDAMDAMLYGRPYALSKNIEEACDEIKRNSGTQFHPIISDYFLDTLWDLNLVF